MSGPHIEQNVEGSNNPTTGTGDIKITNYFAPIAVDGRDRLLSLLDKVERFWIKDVLEASLVTGSLIPLCKVLRPDLDNHPLQDITEVPDQSRKDLSPGTKIVDIFNEAGRILLILGSPGSGKTFTLLELTRDLIAISREELNGSNPIIQPIPVVFNLSTWGERQGESFYEWLIEELNIRYSFRRDFGELFIKENRILFLLDGLNEVRSDRRQKCITAIHDFIKRFGVPEYVICCRTDEYVPLPFHINRTVELQPVTPEQTDNYLALAGPQLSGVRTVLQESLVIQEVVKTPLMLSIAIAAYKGLQAEDIRVPDLAEKYDRFNQLFEIYVDRMFIHRGERQEPYSKSETLYFLRTLAQKMIEHSQSEFLIEQLQPGWLSTRLYRFIYVILSRLIGGFIPGMVYGLVLGLTYDWTMGLVWGVVLGLVGGIAISIVDAVRFEASRIWKFEPKLPPWLYKALNALQYGLSAFFLYLFCGIIIPAVGTTLPSILSEGLLWILMWGTTLGVLFGLREGKPTPEEDIQTFKALRWSWKDAGKLSIPGFIAGLVIGVFWWAYWDLIYKQYLNTLEGIVDSVFFIAGLGLFFAIAGGLRRVAYRRGESVSIELYLRSAIYAGLVGGAVIGLFIGLSEWIFIGLNGWSRLGVLDGFIRGLEYGFYLGGVGGLCSGLFIGLSYGGLGIIQHYILRFLLSVTRTLPCRLNRFLEHANNLILLRKKGGGYIFIHNLFRKYFAEHDASK